MFVRFVIPEIDRGSGRRQGLFQAAKVLKDRGVLSGADDDHLQDVLHWFNCNLEKPSRLSLSPKPNSKSQAISWFKDTATSHIAKMREYQEILERYGLSIQTIKTDRPGYVVYEDEFQVAAYPFKETGA